MARAAMPRPTPRPIARPLFEWEEDAVTDGKGL